MNSVSFHLRGRRGGKPLQHVETGCRRHADIGQYEIRLQLQDGEKALRAIGCDVHLKSALDQLFCDQRRGLVIVFDTEDLLTRLPHDIRFSGGQPNDGQPVMLRRPSSKE
jgi:hypothetical protein